MRGLTEMEKESIKKKAYDLLKEYCMVGNVNIDVVRLAKNMGFVVGTLNFKNGEEGFIMINNKTEKILGVKTNKLIGIEDSLDVPKKRFVIAHELGHYVLNYDKNQSIYAMRDSAHGRNDAENDVDYFAACLLMHEDVFKKEFEKLKQDSADDSDDKKYKIASQLGKIFTVPELSALRRMDELSLKG